ncbi:hypothetical protein ACA910_012470 [Epithemia clementina (nom. ined.)]
MATRNHPAIQFQGALRRNSKKQSSPWFVIWGFNSFYSVVILTCFLLLASLFDDVDAPAYHHNTMVEMHSSSYNSKNYNGLTITQGNKFGSQSQRHDNYGASINNRFQLTAAHNTSVIHPKIAYAVTLTSCGNAFNQTTADPNAVTFQIAEGAAVLAHSIRRASLGGTLRGRYDYELVALYHPDAQACVGVLEELGFRLIPRNVFVKVEEIEGEFLRQTIETSGCCGEKELIKMEAYTLLEYPLVLILDLDCLIFQPLDFLFDYMLHNIPLLSDDLQWPQKTLPQKPSLLYTLDYAMVSPSRKIKPMQGGFLLIRPNLNVYEEMRSILKKGDYRRSGGWAGKTGKYWGGHTIQGLLPYYYLLLHGGGENATAVELNRCIYNNMAPNPKTVDGLCFVKDQEPCRDCRQQPIATVRSTHFTVCQKPWHCQRSQDRPQCRNFHHEWFRIRSEMEQSWGRSGLGSSGKWSDSKHFFGYCTRRGSRGYEPIQRPYGSLPSA